ncbi:MAG: TonB-dependent receptor [Bacteroidota bacterium]
MSRLLLFILGVFVAPAVTYAGIYGTLVGKVTDAEGKPVSGATIKVEGTTRGAYAKADGNYTVSNITSGTYTIRVTGVGYKDNTTRLTISADQTLTHNVKLQSDVVQTKGVEVVAKRDVDATQVGTINSLGTKELTNVPRETVQSVVLLTPGVIQGGNGWIIRGSRPTETQIRVDGLDVGDQFTGGFGATGFNEYPTVSNFATEEVQVLTGAFSAEYGRALGGIVNTVVKTGKTDAYEGLLRYRTDLGFLNGTAGNGPGSGLKLEEKGLNTFEGNIGGPIPFLGSSTFFLSGKYETQKYRDNGYAVIDPIGNNLGQMPNNGLWIRNITGRMRFAVTDDIGLILGGTFGRTNREVSGWGWLYANDKGAISATADIEERRAKQQVVDQLIQNAFARVNHSLSESSFYEFTLSTNINENRNGRRSSFDDPSFFGGFEFMEPQNNLSINDNGDLTLAEPDQTIDQYTELNESFVRRNMQGDTLRDKDGIILRDDLPRINPLTGYYEGNGFAQASQNPYGIPGFFYSTGSVGGFASRKSNFFQADGNFTTRFGDPEGFMHVVKTGFETRVFSISKNEVNNPEAENPFYDIYGANNFYASTPEINAINKDDYNPITGAMFVQDQITYKGIIINPGLRFDITDTRSLYRTSSSITNAPVSFVGRSSDSGFAESTVKYQFSPRLFIAYPVTENTVLNISYGVYFQMPQYNELFDGFNNNEARGNMILGNPNLEAQQTKAYQVGFEQQINEDFSAGVTAYYKDIYNQAGIRFVEAIPFPYAEIANAEYGNSRGLEFSFRKRPTDHIGINVNYTLASARGTSSSTNTNYAAVFLAGTDEATGKRTFPLSESYLAFDRRHNLNAVVDFVWNRDEGPSIGGIYALANTNINFTGIYQSGTPYTKRGKGGQQTGDYLGDRQPDVWSVSSRIQKSFPLADLFGESVQNLGLDLFVDITNIFNRTEPVAFYERSGNPDNDNDVLSRQPSEVSGDKPAYKSPAASLPNTEFAPGGPNFDNHGNLRYNERVDFDKDGIVTQKERHDGYLIYVRDAQSRRANYQQPRQVSAGFMIRF